MKVEVLVFPQYSIQDDFILGHGEPTKKELNRLNIERALNDFIKIKKPRDAINFAKRFGLLNSYRPTQLLLDDFLEVDFSCEIDTPLWIRYEDKFILAFLEISSPGPFGFIPLFDESGFVGEIGRLIGVHKENVLVAADLFSPYSHAELWHNDDYEIIKNNPQVFGSLKKYKTSFSSQKDYPEEEAESYYEKRKHEDFQRSIGEYLGFESSLGKGWAYYIELLRNRMQAIKEELGASLSTATIEDKQQALERVGNKFGASVYFEINNGQVCLHFKSLFDAMLAYSHTLGHVRLCPVCGSLFFGRKDAVYCSCRCAKRAYRRRKGH